MDINDIKELIRSVNSSKLTEFELHLGDIYVRMGKNTGSSEQKFSDINKTEVQLTETFISETIEEPITIMPEDKPAFVVGNLVKSPIVGTFYESSTPNKPAFVAVGSTVSKGDVLCIIEAMKVMNEITSDYDGKIVEILVKNDDMVEFNQPLFRIQ